MNKNTVWAIVLSTVVIFVSYFVLPLIFPSLRPVDSQAIEATAEAEAPVPQANVSPTPRSQTRILIVF